MNLSIFVPVLQHGASQKSHAIYELCFNGSPSDGARELEGPGGEKARGNACPFDGIMNFSKRSIRSEPSCGIWIVFVSTRRSFLTKNKPSLADGHDGEQWRERNFMDHGKSSQRKKARGSE